MQTLALTCLMLLTSKVGESRVKGGKYTAENSHEAHFTCPARSFFTARREETDFSTKILICSAFSLQIRRRSRWTRKVRVYGVSYGWRRLAARDRCCRHRRCHRHCEVHLVCRSRRRH